MIMMVMMTPSSVAVTTTGTRLDPNSYPLVSWNFHMNLLVPVLHKYAPRHDECLSNILRRVRLSLSSGRLALPECLRATPGLRLRHL